MIADQIIWLHVRSKRAIAHALFAKAGIAEQYDEKFKVEDINLDPFEHNSYFFDDDDDILTL